MLESRHDTADIAAQQIAIIFDGASSNILRRAVESVRGSLRILVRKISENFMY